MCLVNIGKYSLKASFRRIIKTLINGDDYRIEIIKLINSQFLSYVIDFFKKVVDAKIKNQNINIDWYKQELLSPDLPTEDLAINAGLNKKTITNMYNSATKKIVLEASEKSYNLLYEEIKQLVDYENNLDITLNIKLGKVSVDLNINESLIVINRLAVKRSSLRGAAWSKVGKQVEKPLMQTYV